MKIIFLLTIMFYFIYAANAQYKKNGMPDMRYKANKETYGNSHSTPSYSSGANSDVRYQSGYTKSNGTYIEPHYKTDNTKTNWDNFSTKDNTNIYTGTTGTRAKDYSNEAQNYGREQTIQTGSKGGQYYNNSKGNKIYVPKRY